MNGMFVVVNVPKREDLRSSLERLLAEQVPEERMNELLRALLSGCAIYGGIPGKRVQLGIITTAILDGLTHAEDKCVISQATAKCLIKAYIPNAPWHRDSILAEIKVRCKYPAYASLSHLRD